ncbi:MAG: low-specificity L-threonine aldolase [Chloroflexota bacterium]|nr:low-specificity L-threonine aldolase [Chloroflexota bacterium]
MREIDLRSDTVTLPTPAMREAMYTAELGDDVYGEDPTVNKLEEMSAERFGKEAGLFVASGTMGNLVSLLTHCGRGDEIILGHKAHTFLYEAGGVSALGGIHTYTVPNLPNGMLDPDDVERAIRDKDNPHFPRTRVVCLENTHNRCGGRVLSPSQMSTISEVARRHGLAVHLDGARIFNAAIALGIEAKEIAAEADSLQVCFSKGLSAPIGSVICGSAEFIAEARRTRKVLGGGMRQAGVIAAAAIVALEEMVERLAEDHENARVLAEGLANIDGFCIDLESVESNLVYFGLEDPTIDTQAVVAAFADRGVKLNALGPHEFRAVTHYGIVREDVDRALVAAADVMREVA